jgi:hypothetical protein
MIISPANMLLAASAPLMAVPIFLQLRLNAREPEQRALLAQSRPTPMPEKIRFFLIGALILIPYPYKFMAFAVLVLAAIISSVAQRRALLRLGANPVFVRRWTGTLVLLACKATHRYRSIHVAHRAT